MLFLNGEGNDVSSSDTKHVGKEKREGQRQKFLQKLKRKKKEKLEIKKDKGRIKKMKEEMC